MPTVHLVGYRLRAHDRAAQLDKVLVARGPVSCCHADVDHMDLTRAVDRQFKVQGRAHVYEGVWPDLEVWRSTQNSRLLGSTVVRLSVGTSV
jgi:hypothetical protein